MQQCNPFTLEAASALAQYRLITVDNTGKAAYCGLAGVFVGVSTLEVASGAQVSIDSRYRPGTVMLTASKAIAIGAAIYAAANGKVTDTAANGGNQIGWTLEAASGDGSVIQCVFAGPGATSV